MRILMAVVVMGAIAVAAAMIVAVEALMRLLPLLIVALAGWAVLRVRVRRRRHPTVDGEVLGEDGGRRV